ncbi:MAG: TetR/AcrR family transcriptional regulator [Steroidobacteraceae bacterium]|jgi:AcrR family transcriptional regulator|nr:TetR/AcrR family transcriptional regulator [Steroidobacteraceae bacterium]
MRGIPTRGRGLSRRQTSEKALLDSFEALLARHGPNGLGVNAVLDSAKVGKRLLYEYFGDLEGLAAAWSRERTDPLDLESRAAAILRRVEGRPPAEVLAVVLADYAEQLRVHPWAAQVLLAELAQPSTLGNAMREIRRELGRGYEKLLIDSRAFDQREAVQAALILHAAATYLAMRARFAPDYNGIDLASQQGWQAAMDAFHAFGLAAPEGSRRSPPTPGPSADAAPASRPAARAGKKPGARRAGRPRGVQRSRA